MEALPTTSQIANPLRNLGGLYLDLSKCAIGKEAGVQKDLGLHVYTL